MCEAITLLDDDACREVGQDLNGCSARIRKHTLAMMYKRRRTRDYSHRDGMWITGHRTRVWAMNCTFVSVPVFKTSVSPATDDQPRPT